MLPAHHTCTPVTHAHLWAHSLAGTSERVLLLSGTLHSVLTSVFLMLEKLPKEPIMAMGRAAAKPREDVVCDPVLAPGAECARGHGVLMVAAASSSKASGERTLLHTHPSCTPSSPCNQPTNQPTNTTPQVKMAVSRKLCGAVIGQKGQTIRDFMLDSGATIRVQVGVCLC